MRRVTLVGTQIEVSRLSFGTASLHHLASAGKRDDLLATALDHGFSHFDTAPYYGFGIAEQSVGRFLARHRAKVTVATKVGLYARGSGEPSIASVWMRKAMGRLWPSLSHPVADWSISAASKSLDCSLRRLRTDSIDLLLLHEPDAAVIASDMYLDWLTREQVKGRIRAWGLAGPRERMESWVVSGHPLAQVLQVKDSVHRREADVLKDFGRDPQITYGYLSAAERSQPSRSAADVLRLALQRNVSGSILVSTRQTSRVRELAAVGGVP
jgi:aryl-alcohol dehydrogenase-like predicted oxidoreductase